MTRRPRIVAPSSAALTGTGKASRSPAQTVAPGARATTSAGPAGVVRVVVREDHVRHVAPAGPDRGEFLSDGRHGLFEAGVDEGHPGRTRTPSRVVIG